MKIYFVRPNIERNCEDSFLRLVNKLIFDKPLLTRIYTIDNPLFLRLSNLLSKKILVPVYVDYNLDSFDHFELKMGNFVADLINHDQDVIVILPLKAIHYILSYFTKIPLEHVEKMQIDFNSLSLLDSSDFKLNGVSYIKLLNDSNHLKFP